MALGGLARQGERVSQYHEDGRGNRRGGGSARGRGAYRHSVQSAPTRWRPARRLHPLRRNRQVHVGGVQPVLGGELDSHQRRKPAGERRGAVRVHARQTSRMGQHNRRAGVSARVLDVPRRILRPLRQSRRPRRRSDQILHAARGDCRKRPHPARTRGVRKRRHPARRGARQNHPALRDGEDAHLAADCRRADAAGRGVRRSLPVHRAGGADTARVSRPPERPAGRPRRLLRPDRRL